MKYFCQTSKAESADGSAGSFRTGCRHVSIYLRKYAYVILFHSFQEEDMSLVMGIHHVSMEFLEKK